MDALISSSNKKFVVLIILFLTFLFIPFNITFAQLTVSGKISDPNFNPVGNATVEIFDQFDTLNNYTTITDASGYFVISNITDIENYSSIIPNEYLVIRNYPNPFNPSTIIYFEIPKAENIEIKIFDILGREIRSLFSGFHNFGVDQINWDGKNNFNQPVSAGIYLCQLKTKDHFNVHKMVFLDGGTSSKVSISYNKLSNQNIQKPAIVNSRFNFNVKVTGDSLDTTYFRNLSCTKDTTLNLIVSKIIKTETIGIEGGIVGNDDFMISIPSGAFDGNYDISLIKTGDDGAYGENTVTASFIIKGLPSEYNNKIKIAAKYTGELSGESYLAVGKKVYNVFIEDTSVVYDLFFAKDSSDYLVAEIPYFSYSLEKSLNKSTLSDNDNLTVKAITSINSTETQHFTIMISEFNKHYTSTVAEIFEDAYKVIYEVLELPFLEGERFVYIDFDEESDPVTTIRILDKHRGYKVNKMFFTINRIYLENNQYNEILVGAVQKLFMNDRWNDNYWTNRALYYWLEDLVTDDSNYKYPYAFLNNAMAPFNGIEINNKDELSHLNHARGMTSIFKYLQQIPSFELTSIGHMFNNSGAHKITALLNAVGTPVVNWYPKFFEDYINGIIYDIPIDYFLEQTQNEWNIDDENDNLKIFKSSDFLIKNYPDLSAKLFKINLNYADIDASQNMLLSMKGPVTEFGLSLVIFGIQNGNAVHLGTVDAQDFEIENLKDYYDNNMRQFLVCLVNSAITSEDYLGQSDIDLTVNITPKTTISDFDLTYTKCSATIVIYANLEVETGGSTENKTEQLIFGSEYAIGSFEGNTYTGSYYREGYNEGSYFSGVITVTLNEAHDSIVYASFTGLDEDPYWDIRWEKGFTAEDIPISPYENNVFTFQYNNTDNVCKSILKVNYYLKQSSVTAYIDHTCNEFSNVSFRFSKE